MSERISLLLVIVVLLYGLLTYPHATSSAQQPPVDDATLAEALELAQQAYANNNSWHAYIEFDNGDVLHIGDVTEIGVDFLCFLVQPPSLPSNVTPGPQSRVDRCFPISRIRQVDLSYRIPR